MDLDKNGMSLENAIFLDMKDTSKGIAAEYNYLEKKFGVPELDWKLELQFLVSEMGRYYDKIIIKLPNGNNKTIFFDITSFYGK